MPRTLRHLRWYIGTLLFFSTVINYIDRQTLSILAPVLKTEFHWTNSDYALVLISFRVAYAVGQAVSGRFLDIVGTRRGLTWSVAAYSIVAALTSLATGLRSFCAFRFLLGAGESANWPGATKTVAEWFPRQESGWAVALFDSGSSIGAAVAPWLVLTIYHLSGSWRPAFLVTGLLGFAWLPIFRWMYRRPEDHPRLSADERRTILEGRAASGADTGGRRLSYRTLLSLPQTWGIIIGKTLTDPVWFFITDWFAIFLVAKGFRLESSLLAFWVPFVAADLGNFFGGGLSSWLIARGWAVGTARKFVIVICAFGMTLLIPAVVLTSLPWLVACFAVSTFAYAALSTMVLNLPADVYPPHSVASVSGLSGAGAGVGTVAATYAIGQISDRYSFGPILVGASLIPLIAAAAIVLLVRNTEATERGIVNAI
jgi:ACS family hexuronate transporter-like MFS transporter